MEEKKQFEILFKILREFDHLGLLRELMLIGSWCLYFYRFEDQDPTRYPSFRTLDVDFLIPHPRQIKQEIDIPELLKQMGFVSTYNRANDFVKYDHPELSIEFLIPELGKGSNHAQKIEKLHIRAQALRYLGFLADYPKVISYRGLQIRAPEPAAFALHKLIVSTRRSKSEKGARDLEAAVGLLDHLFSKPSQLTRIQSILNSLPKPWVKTIMSVAQEHYPKLLEFKSK